VTVILIVCVVALVLVVGLAIRSRRSRDAVADFRRQIDALSPEARKDVTDRVRRIGETTEDGDGNGS
jgi:hypothetical protein